MTHRSRFSLGLFLPGTRKAGKRPTELPVQLLSWPGGVNENEMKGSSVQRFLILQRCRRTEHFPGTRDRGARPRSRIKSDDSLVETLQRPFMIGLGSRVVRWCISQYCGKREMPESIQRIEVCSQAGVEFLQPRKLSSSAVSRTNHLNWPRNHQSNELFDVEPL